MSKERDEDGVMKRKGTVYTLLPDVDYLAVLAMEMFSDKIAEAVKEEEKCSGLPVRAIVVDDQGSVCVFTAADAGKTDLELEQDGDTWRRMIQLALPLGAYYSRVDDGPKVYVINTKAKGYNWVESIFFYNHHRHTRVVRELLAAIPKEFHLELLQTAMYRRPMWDTADFDGDSKIIRGRHIIAVTAANTSGSCGKRTATFVYADYITKKEVSVRFN